MKSDAGCSSHRKVFFVLTATCVLLVASYHLNLLRLFGDEVHEHDYQEYPRNYSALESQWSDVIYRNDTISLNDTTRRVIHTELRKRGLESTELHAFKSVYIQDPTIYNSQLTPKAPGNRETKIISCFNCPRWYLGKGTASYNRDFQKCPYSECLFDDTGTMQKEATVVMFFPNPRSMPPRPVGQIWAHTCWEPPHYYRFARVGPETERWKGVFNWTFGYEQHHHIFHPNNVLAWRAEETLLTDEGYMSFATRKTKTAVWWVSHCNVQSNRDNYVREMQKYIDVDIYGKCGPRQCKMWGECSHMFNDTYKFYLAFENSFCEDYVTPKYFRNFSGRTLILPVVRGGFNYRKYLPSTAFIDANDFSSAKELALYLKNLASDLPRYARLLKEKDRLIALEYKNDWCDFCKMLHTNVKNKTIPDVRQVTHHNGVCWTNKSV